MFEEHAICGSQSILKISYFTQPFSKSILHKYLSRSSVRWLELGKFG